MKSILVILSLVFLLVNMAYADTKDYIITPEDEKAAQEVIAELPNAEPLEEPEADQTNTIVIKLKENQDLQGILDSAGIRADTIEEIKYSLPSDKSPNIGTASKESLGENPGSWYWYLGKDYKEINEGAKEEKEDFSLEYRLTLGQGLTVAEAITKLRANPNIEYIIPDEYAVE